MSAIKHFWKTSIERSSQVVPLPFLLRVSRAAPLVVFYHTVSDRELPHIMPLYRHLTTREFERQIDILLRRFVPVGLEAILRWLHHGTALPANAIYFTFDDGLREVAEIVAPILKRKGVTAAVFVNTSFIDNRSLFYRFKAALIISRLTGVSPAALNEANARLAAVGIGGRDVPKSIMMVGFKASKILDELADIFELDLGEYVRSVRPYMDTIEIKRLINDGFDIGGHGTEHARFSELTLAEQLGEVRKDMAELCSRFTLRHRIFAFPFGGEGVGDEFFETVRREAIAEAIFGTGGWYHDRRSALINRLWLEGVPRLSADDLKRSLGVAMIARLTNQG